MKRRLPKPSFPGRFLTPVSLLLILLLLPAGRGYAESDSRGGRKDAAQPDSAYIRVRRLLDRSLKDRDFNTAGLCYQEIGDILMEEGAMPQALANYHKADAYFTSEMATVNIGNNLNRIGKIYFKNKRYPKALANFRQALQLLKSKRDHRGIAESLGYIGQVFEQQGNHDSSFIYQELALSELKKINDRDQIAHTYSRIASIYEDQGKFPVALKYFLLAYQIYSKEAPGIRLAAVLNNIGDTYRKIGSYREALFYSKKAELLAAKLHDNRQLSSAHRDLAKTFEQLGAFDSAYYYSEKSRTAYAKSYNTDSEQRLNLIQTVFDVQRKDNEIQQLENKNRLSRILTFSVCISAVLATFLGISLLSRQRLKIRNSKILYEAHQQAMELELHNKHLQQEALKAELELRSKELTSITLHMIKKNEVLDELKTKLASIVRDDRRDQRKELKQLVELMNINSSQDKNWEDFRVVFENVHKDFFEKLIRHSSSLTTTDLRFLALLKMNLNSADIATMLAVSQTSLRTTRYRLRKKLQLPEEASLQNFVHNL